MREWTITAKLGWLVFADTVSTTVMEADRVALFGTCTGGFAVTAAGERMFFECEPRHARQCVDQLMRLLSE